MRNQKFVISLDSFSNQKYIYLYIYIGSVCIDYPVESCKIIVFLFGSILPNLLSHWRGLSSRNRGIAHPLFH